LAQSEVLECGVQGDLHRGRPFSSSPTRRSCRELKPPYVTLDQDLQNGESECKNKEERERKNRLWCLRRKLLLLRRLLFSASSVGLYHRSRRSLGVVGDARQSDKSNAVVFPLSTSTTDESFCSRCRRFRSLSCCSSSEDVGGCLRSPLSSAPLAATRRCTLVAFLPLSSLLLIPFSSRLLPPPPTTLVNHHGRLPYPLLHLHHLHRRPRLAHAVLHLHHLQRVEAVPYSLLHLHHLQRLEEVNVRRPVLSCPVLALEADLPRLFSPLPLFSFSSHAGVFVVGPSPAASTPSPRRLVGALLFLYGLSSVVATLSLLLVSSDFARMGRKGENGIWLARGARMSRSIRTFRTERASARGRKNESGKSTCVFDESCCCSVVCCSALAPSDSIITAVDLSASSATLDSRTSRTRSCCRFAPRQKV
jgi:hypothetical protein